MNNPYGAPTADLSPVELSGETYEPKLLSLKGRIGRLRYLAYSVVLSITVVVVAGLLAGLLLAATGSSLSGINTSMLETVGNFLVGVVTLGVTIRRLHDLEQSGRWAVLSLIPWINLLFAIYLTFFAGSKGLNRYGPVPAKNTGGIIAGALILPSILILAVLAAIAIPAYKAYSDKASAEASGSSF